MITALDTNVLLDVFTPDPVFGPKSWQAMIDADGRGGLVICEVVYAELALRFATQDRGHFANLTILDPSQP